MRNALIVAAAAQLLLACFVPAPAYAQATGAIAGIVSDATGGVIPGVTIDVTNTATNQVRTAVTGADGYYSLVQLQPGPYQVKATLAGFKAVVHEGVTVSVETTSRVDLQLSVGAVAESVTVTGDAPLVETRSATLGTVVEGEKISELPLNGRNFAQLGTIMPGVVAPPAALGGAAGDATPGGFGAVTSGFSVNGMRNQSNNFLLDGASNNDTFNTGFVLRPPPDAIQEFKILTHSYSAEYGRSAGSVINVVTKQFGGMAGGPFLKNRLFGFGYYEGFRNITGVTQNFAVLTDAQRQGNFGSVTIRDPLTGLPFASNQIPLERFDQAALKLMNDFVPHANSGADRYIVSPDLNDDRDQFGIRFDSQLTKNNTVLGRYIRSHTDRVEPPTTRPIGTTSIATLQDVMASDTHVFSNAFINVARGSYNRIAANPAVTSGLQNSAYGINVPHNVPSAQGLANIMVTGFFSLGDAQQPFVERLNEVAEFSDDLVWMRGGHQLKFGFDVRREHMFIAFVNRPNGDFTFTSSPNARTGNAAADFLLGLPAQFRRTTQNTPQDGYGWTYAGYFQDEFRPWSRVTLNAGVRYEVAVPFIDKNGALNAFRPGQQSQRFPDAPAGLVYPGDPGVPDGTYATDMNNIAPRIGLAWDVAGDGRKSLRAAWGLFYDALAGQGDFFQNGVLAPPFTPLVEVNAPPAPLTLRNPISAISGGATNFPPGLIFIGWGEDFKQPVAHHFNVTWQQELRRDMGVEVGYVGSRGLNLPIFMEVNPGVYAPGQTAPGARLFPAFSLVRPTFSVAKSWYDSLQASVRMRPSRGTSFLVSYTLAHSVDHVSGLNIGGEQRPVLPVTIGDEASVERALTFEKGDALFDVRQRISVSVTAELPTPDRFGPVGAALLGGWQWSGIVQAQTGFPTTVFDPNTSILYLTNRPNQTCDPNEDAPHTVDQWFNTACFVRRPVPETAEPGTTPRDSVRGPGFASTTLALVRNIDLHRAHRLQLRVEAFNLFNQTRFGQPGNQIGTPNFGRITSADDGRIVQLAVKYRF